MGKKSLCKFVEKDVHKEELVFYSGLGDRPRFACEKSSRSANEKNRL